MNFSIVGFSGISSIREGKREQFFWIFRSSEGALEGGKLSLSSLFSSILILLFELNLSRVYFSVVLDLAQLLIILLIGHVEDDPLLILPVKRQWNMTDEFSFYGLCIF